MEPKIYWKFPEYIVQCEWLNERLDCKTIRVFDCTTYLIYQDSNPEKPYDVESGFQKYKKSHIPGSAFIDIQNNLSVKSSPYSFTIPGFSELKNTFEKLGIGDEFHIILYSRNGIQWATRVWWLLFSLGFTKVSILDGGYKEWKRLGLPTKKGTNKFKASKFSSSIRKDIFIDKNSVLGSIKDDSCTLLNSLTQDIYSGENPRYGRPGRIPNSVNVPFHDLLDTDTGKFKPPQIASKIFLDKKISKDKKIINYCGGGIAATLDAFVLLQLGYNKLEIYDNSMSEWAIDDTLPIEKD